jgi:class 3 adenylate cyclase
MTAATACRTCGSEPREGARFCDACGSVIAPATEHTVHKFTGDGVVAVFGAEAMP